MIRQSIQVLAVRSWSVIANVGLNYLITNMSTISDAGAIFFSIAITILLATCMRMGLDQGMLIEIAKESRINARTKHALCATMICMTKCILLWIPVILGVLYAAIKAYGLGHNALSLCCIITLTSASTAYIFTFAEYAKGVGRMNLSTLIQFGATPTVAIVLALLAGPVGQIQFLGVILAASTTTCIFALSLFLRRPERTEAKTQYLKRWPDKRDIELFWSNFFTNILTFLPVIALKLFAGNVDLARFEIARRIANLLNNLQLALNTVQARKLIRYHYKNRTAAIANMMQSASLLGGTVGLAAVVVIGIFGGGILGVFGAEYSPAKNVLVVLAAAQAINLGTGSVATYLNLTGSEQLVRKTIFWIGISQAILLVIMVPACGAYGSALTLAFGGIAMNVLMTRFVINRSKFNPVGLLNIFQRC